MATVAALGVSLVIIVITVGVSFVRAKRKSTAFAAVFQAVAPMSVSDLGSLGDGTRVRVIGTAKGTELVKAPYSGAACLAFHGERSATVGDQRNARTIAGPSSQDAKPFVVDDGTGTIAVDVAHVTLDLTLHLTSAEDINKNVFGAKMLARDTASQSYSEHILEPSTQVAVVGTVTRGADGTLRLTGTFDAPVAVSNRQSAMARVG